MTETEEAAFKLCWKQICRGNDPCRFPSLTRQNTQYTHGHSNRPLSASPLSRRQVPRDDPRAGEGGRERETKAPRPSSPIRARETSPCAHPTGRREALSARAPRSGTSLSRTRRSRWGSRPLKPTAGEAEAGARLTISRVKPLKSEPAEPPPRSQGTNMPARDEGSNSR